MRATGECWASYEENLTGGTLGELRGIGAAIVR